MTDHEAYEHWFSTTTGPRFAWEAWQEAVRLEREAAKPLIDAAEKALHEMCHTNSPRESFTDAVDALDAAITAIRARSEL